MDDWKLTPKDIEQAWEDYRNPKTRNGAGSYKEMIAQAQAKKLVEYIDRHINSGFHGRIYSGTDPIRCLLFQEDKWQQLKKDVGLVEEVMMPTFIGCLNIQSLIKWAQICVDHGINPSREAVRDSETRIESLNEIEILMQEIPTGEYAAMISGKEG